MRIVYFEYRYYCCTLNYRGDSILIGDNSMRLRKKYVGIPYFDGQEFVNYFSYFNLCQCLQLNVPSRLYWEFTGNTKVSALKKLPAPKRNLKLRTLSYIRIKSIIKVIFLKKSLLFCFQNSDFLHWIFHVVLNTF